MASQSKFKPVRVMRGNFITSKVMGQMNASGTFKNGSPSKDLVVAADAEFFIPVNSVARCCQCVRKRCFIGEQYFRAREFQNIEIIIWRSGFREMRRPETPKLIRF